MAFRLAIDPAARITRVWFLGSVTGRDIIAATAALVEHPEYEETMDQLWDFSQVTTLAISPEEMEEMVSHDTGLVEEGVMGRVKVAIVVTGEMRIVAARLYQHQMQPTGQDVRLFEVAAAAEAWIQERGATAP